MVRASVRFGALGVAALVAVSGGWSSTTPAALPRPGIVSLDLRTHAEHLFPLRDLAGLSPEGRRIAFVTSPGNHYQLRVQRLDGSHDHVLVRMRWPLSMGEPRWSPNGRTIAYLRFDPACPTGPPGCHGAVQLWLVRPAGGPPKLLSDDADGAAWAPDSQRLAFGAEVDAGAGLARLTVASPDGFGRVAFGQPRSIFSLSWSPDGSTLFYSTNSTGFPQFGDGAIHAVDPATGGDHIIAAGLDPKSSADGKFLSFVHLHGKRVTLLVLHNGKPRVVLSRPNFFFAHAWSRRGHLLAFAATNRFGQDRVFVYDPDRAKPLRAVTRWGYGPVRSIAWSRDGRRILFERVNG